MKPRSRVTVTVMATVWLLVGCSAEGGEDVQDAAALTDNGDDAGTSEPQDPEGLSRAERGLVSISVTGDLTMAWEGEHGLRIVTIAPEEERAVHLFSVGFEDFLPIPQADAGHFRWAFDVTGGYDGAGTYWIRGENDPETEDGGAVRSGAFLLHVMFEDPEHEPLEDPDNVVSVTNYNELIEGCTVEVTEAEAAGSLLCPALGNHEGGTIGLEVTWQLLEG